MQLRSASRTVMTDSSRRVALNSKMDVYGELYYQNTVEDENIDEVYGCYDIETWHKILGHCNFDDVAKLEKVV